MADEAHWQVAAREWLAVITILRALGRKLRRWVSLILLSKQYIACVARSGDSEARDRKRAGVKRALEKARVVEGKRRQAAHFEVLILQLLVNPGLFCNFLLNPGLLCIKSWVFF